MFKNKVVCFRFTLNCNWLQCWIKIKLKLSIWMLSSIAMSSACEKSSDRSQNKKKEDFS